MAKRHIPKAVFEPWDSISATDLIETPQLVELVKKEAPQAIRDAFDNKKTFATLFQINHSEYYIDIPKSYWVNALEVCIRYYIEDQCYEDCKDIKKLIDDINAGMKSLLKTSKTQDNGKNINRDTISDQ